MRVNWVTISQNTPSIMNSSLKSEFSICLLYLINPQQPQKTIRTGTATIILLKFTIGFNSLI